jgi:hypothetical protein
MIEKTHKLPDRAHSSGKEHFLINNLVSLILILALSVFPAFSQKDSSEVKKQKYDRPEQIISLFDSDEPLDITLAFDITGFLKKTLKGDSFEGVMTIHFSETDSLIKKTTIKNRGEFRFQNCSFPPIQLNFKKPLYANSDSGRIKKLKLVTHCQPGSVSDEYILREYLVYKLFNVLTDASFRVRLLKVNYIDTKRNRKPVRQYGFFIEPIELLAERTNSVIVKTTNLSQKDIVPEVMDQLAIFNYMVSNWDWSMPGQHNVAVIKPIGFDPSGLGIAIPYDFDLTGVVNADYAVPPPDIEIKNIRERLFFGICRSKEVFQQDLKKFLEKKESLYAEINGFPYLNQRSKKDITFFLDQFFDQIGKQKGLDNLVDLFMNRCKKL